VKVVALPQGIDPADDPAGFQQLLTSAEPYLLYRVRIETEREEDREVQFRNIKALLDEAPDSPERQDAWRYANDKLGMTVQLRAGGSSARAGTAVCRSACSMRARSSSGTRLPASSAHDQLKPLLAELTPTTSTTRCIARSGRTSSTAHPSTHAAVGLLAELDARAVAEGIDAATGEELIWRLRERQLRRELQSSDPTRTKELQEALQRLLERSRRAELGALGEGSRSARTRGGSAEPGSGRRRRATARP